MKNERKFYRCELCGNIITHLENSGAPVVCCGEEMQEIVPNTTDAAKEKHVPAATRDGNVLTVTIGSVPHPMTEEHHIAWIAVAEGNKTQHVQLSHTGAPSAVFRVDESPVTVYEYCNLHGLWVADL